MKKRLNIVRT